ncbi:FG-GAP-like repeat-containing protein [Lentzea alba]|uniref:LamG-like jellyroll fold domain-containing protein n=1 Tax=Lentzea alba TaxID=2714351 RepID=UPI0039BF8CD0
MRRAGEAQGVVLRAFVSLMVISTFVVAPAKAAEPECADSQQTASAAVAMAARCDRRVEAVELRTEDSQTFAKPGGGFTMEQSAEPRFARRSDGSWARVDTNLRVVNGKVTPAAAVLPVEFSAGGTGPAARLRDGDRELSITWPLGALPAPVLSGSDALYREVLPGVDLKLTASSQGFSEVLVVKTREAAANPKLAKVTFGFATVGVTAHRAGSGLEAKDSAGKVVFTSPTPVMWDSGGTGSAGVSAKTSMTTESAQTDSPEKRTATMPVAVENGQISVVPDAAMLNDTATRYPVMIDPSWTGRVHENSWTLVSEKLPDYGYWQGGGYLSNPAELGAAGTGRTCDSVSRAGSCLSPTYRIRSYFRMDTSQVKGKIILGASLRIEQRWAWTCNNGGSNVTARATNDFDGHTTWNNQPAWWGDNAAKSAPANRKVGAVHGCDGPGDVEFNFTDTVAHAAANNWNYFNVVMHVDESSVNYWKRFNAGTAVLAIDFNSVPNTPEHLSADGKTCATGAARPIVPTATPTFRGHVSDPDPADAMNARFEWRRIRPNGSMGPISSADRYPWGNGTTAEYTPSKPENLESGVVEWSDSPVGTGDWDNDGHPDILIRDTDGFLYLLPTVVVDKVGYRSGVRVELGFGWNGFTIAGVADWDGDGHQDVVAREDSTGDLYVYPGDAGHGALSQSRARIGWGWGGFTFAGVADYDRDGKQDVIAKDADGVLWLYPGESKRSPSTQDRAQLGYGWNGVTYVGVVDRTGDGKPDVLAYTDDGKLWLYLGSGTRSAYTGTPYRHEIGTGWQGAIARTIGDLNWDGAPDIVAKVPWSSDWSLYPGVVGTGPGGNRWAIAGQGLTTGDYAYRMTAGDWQRWGEATIWCEFTVDITKPQPPAFSSSVYKDKSAGCPAEGCGSLGIADTFLFSSTSDDVVKYRWGFTDPPSMTVAAGTPVRWTPPSDKAKILFVEAVDRAGLASVRSTFGFKVAGAKANDASWFSSDDPAADATGNGHDLSLTGLDTASSGRTAGGNSAVGFSGTVANGATTGKVVDTGKGFSVSAWVRLGDDTVSRTVVSQQGSATSAFRLGFDSTSRKWTFSLAESDAANAAQKSAVSDASVTKGVWTHLTGTYDELHREVRLYVDGALQRTIAVVDNGFSANGQLWIGKALRTSAVEPWNGSMAEVRAWNRTVTPEEALAMADARQVSEVGKWQFDEGDGSTARDTSPYGRDLTLSLDGASWGEGVEQTSGLELNGVDSSASTSEKVLNTDQSFSVDVWAKLDGSGTPRTVVSQNDSTAVDMFALRYDGAQWSAEMRNAASSPSWWQAKADAVVNKWTHLVVTYDASARTLKLTVGHEDSPDTLKSTVTGVTGANSDGVLRVGRSQAGEFFKGNVDELKVWQGVLAPRTLDDTPRTGASISGDPHDEALAVDTDGKVRAFLNLGTTLADTSQDLAFGWAQGRTWFADIDGDGKSEIIGVDTNGVIKAFKNVNGMNGATFSGNPTIIGSAPGDAVRIRFADIDGDGRADRVSLDADGRVRVYRNLFGMNERGQSTAFSTTPVIIKVTTATPDRIRFADIDGAGGKAEFITVNADQTVSAFHNLNGLNYGSYDTSQEIGTGWTPDRTWFADINGDGRAEIIRVNTDGTMWSWTNEHGLKEWPYAGSTQIGYGWHDPAQVFFS